MISLGGNSIKVQPLLVIEDLLRLSNVGEVLVEVTDEPILGQSISTFSKRKNRSVLCQDLQPNYVNE